MSFIVLVMEPVTLFVFVFKSNWHVPVFFLIPRPGRAYGDSGELIVPTYLSQIQAFLDFRGFDYHYF